MVTVFTPTYNRGNLLPNLYESLKAQTCKEFEWIIVDDGSSDDTGEVIQRFIEKEHSFPIRYVYQSNGGKHRAINRGAEMASGDYFFIVDSDDTLLPEAISYVKKWTDEIEVLNKAMSGHNFQPGHPFAGVSGLKITPDGVILGGYSTKRPYIDANNMDRRRYNLGGDKAEVYRTDLVRQFSFPEFEGENFISEGACFNRIALAGYDIRWYMVPIYQCEYLPGGLSDSIEKNRLRCFRGFTFTTYYGIKEKSMKQRMRSIYVYYKLARKKGFGLFQSAGLIKVNPLEMCFCTCVCRVYEKLIGKYLM